MKKQKLFERPFLFLWLAQIFSQLAFNMMNFILIIFVFEKTLSNTVVSGLVISFSLPALIFGMLAGAYVDRRSKKSILLLANGARAALTILFIFWQNILLLVYILSFFISTATQFFIPAEASTIPRIVGRKRLLSANSLFAITLYASILLGYILAGPVLKILGLKNAFLFTGLLYFVAAFFISFLPSLGGEREVALRDFLRNDSIQKAIFEMKMIYNLVKRVRKILFAIVFLTFSQGIIMILATLLPGYAKNVLGIEATDISLIILIPATLGMVLGSLFLIKFGKSFSRQVLLNLGIISSGVLLSFLPHLSRFKSFSTIILFLFLLGLANSLIVVVSNTILQADTQQNLLGRVYGVVVALSAAFALLPVLIVGGLADILGVGAVLTLIGITVVLAGVVKTYRDYAF